MIDNLTEEEIKNSIYKIKNFDGINYIYNNDEQKSNYIFSFSGEPSDIIFNPKTDISLRERHELIKLITWNSEISAKVVHLKNTFIYLSTYLDRYKSLKNPSDLQYFRYFSEIISYFIVSIRDSILQLINSFTNIFIDEHKLTLSRLKKELEKEKDSKNSEILKALNEFEDRIKTFREEIRNSFTHRSNPFHGYYKTNLTCNNSLEINVNQKIMSEDEFYNKTLLIIGFLSDYIISLRKIMY